MFKINVLVLAMIILLVQLQVSFAQSNSSNDIRIVQQALNKQKYEAGKVDGKFGNKTANAIRQYQFDWELPETGEISRDLIARLIREHPATKPRLQKAENQNCLMDNTYPKARETVIITGDCSSGKLNGQGRVVWRKMFKGQWKETTSNSEYRDGKKNGKGLLADNSGNRYEGEFRDGDFHGIGVRIWPNGDRYEGDWLNGYMNGKGIITWTNGKRYEGDWRDGKRNGKGIITWTNGDRYKGDFLDNEPHGDGVLIWADRKRKRLVGHWIHGRFVKE